MNRLSCDSVAITTETDIVLVRQLVRQRAGEIGLSIVDQTKLVTAASELARNTLVYGKGGLMTAEVLTDGVRRGVRLVFEDAGPGIADIAQALSDGYTSGNGMGLGLGGARRLVNDFRIDSTVGVGTRVEATRWK